MMTPGPAPPIVKMAPVETRDPYGDMLMSGAFDAAKGQGDSRSRGAQHGSTPPLGRAVYTGEKSGKFMATMDFNETNELPELAEGRQDRRRSSVGPLPRR